MIGIRSQIINVRPESVTQCLISLGPTIECYNSTCHGAAPITAPTRSRKIPDSTLETVDAELSNQREGSAQYRLVRRELLT
jgi:hypothetical protein